MARIAAEPQSLLSLLTSNAFGARAPAESSPEDGLFAKLVSTQSDTQAASSGLVGSVSSALPKEIHLPAKMPEKAPQPSIFPSRNEQSGAARATSPERIVEKLNAVAAPPATSPH